MDFALLEKILKGFPEKLRKMSYDSSEIDDDMFQRLFYFCLGTSLKCGKSNDLQHEHEQVGTSSGITENLGGNNDGVGKTDRVLETEFLQNALNTINYDGSSGIGQQQLQRSQQQHQMEQQHSDQQQQPNQQNSRISVQDAQPISALGAAGVSSSSSGKAITSRDINIKDIHTSGTEPENNENIAESGNVSNTRGNDIVVSNTGTTESGSANRYEMFSSNPRTSAQFSLWSMGSLVCRICHTSEQPDRLISPCLCKGTLAYVHKACLEHWLSTSGMLSCELCHFRFRTQYSLRYSLFQSIRLWYRHPNNRGLLQADFLVCSLLTVVSFGIIGICMLGLQYFVIQGKRLGISKLWTQGPIIVFLLIVGFVYCVNLFLILRSQLVPWYRWWQSARQVRLILVDRRPLRRRRKTKTGTIRSADEVEIRSTILEGESVQSDHNNMISITVPSAST